MTIKVQNKLDCYEINGGEVALGQRSQLGVLSHWNVSDWVVLSFPGDGFTITVRARDLLVAVENATNTGGGIL